MPWRLISAFDLADLAVALHGCPATTPVTVLTEGPGIIARLADPATVAALAGAKITVVEAAITDTPSRSAAPDPPPGDLADGYAVLHHDAVLVAVEGMRQLFGAGGGELATLASTIAPQNVRDSVARLSGRNAVAGGSGLLSFDDREQERGRQNRSA